MKKTKKRKPWKGLIIAAAVIGLIVGAAAIIVPKVDTAGYRHILAGWLKSYFMTTVEQVGETKEKTGGIIHGVCHPKFDTEGCLDANVDWVRFDMYDTVFDADGNETVGYQLYKEACKIYTEAGIKVMAITPYPDAYLFSPYFGGDEATLTPSSVDPRTPEGLAYIAKEARYIAEDLQGYVAGIQITNEMPVDRFRWPLTLEEAADFVAVQLEAMNEVKGDIIVGYNVADFQMVNYYEMLAPYNEYCDYLGIDLYLGCFENVFKSAIWYDIILRGFYAQSKLPILLCEFGYIGAGQALTEEERSEFLGRFGYANEEEAKADILNLIENENFNPTLREHLYLEVPDKDPDKLRDLLFNPLNTNNYRQHFYEELDNGYQLKNYEHTREDQAAFYRDVLKKFEKMDFLVGAFAYCWKDSSTCYICGSANCPVETGWGFIDLNGERKPSFDELRDGYAEWK